MSTILHSQEEIADGRRPDVLAHVAGNVRRMRGASGLSQSALAERSGISRRMIVGIEGGEANVSLSTLDRIAEALGASFAEVVRAPDADNSRIDSVAWRGAGAQSKAVLLGTAPAAREVELWHWSLSPGERYPAEADAVNWHEMLYVLEGELTVERDTGPQTVGQGDFLIFRSDTPYALLNAGAGPVRFVRNVIF